MFSLKWYERAEKQQILILEGLKSEEILPGLLEKKDENN